MKNKRYAVQYRRKREQRTNYKKRATLLMSEQPRVIIRRTLTKMIVQIAEQSDKGDKIVITADSSHLNKLGWKPKLNIPTAYLTGYLAGTLAKGKGIQNGVLDIGMFKHTKGGRIYATLKGLVDAGMKINHDASIFPTEQRIKGEHIKKEIAQELEITKSKISEGEAK